MKLSEATLFVFKDDEGAPKIQLSQSSLSSLGFVFGVGLLQLTFCIQLHQQQQLLPPWGGLSLDFG